MKRKQLIEFIGPLVSAMSKTLKLPVTIVAKLDDIVVCATPHENDKRATVDMLIDAALRLAMEELDVAGVYMYMTTRMADWVRNEALAEAAKEALREDADEKAVKATNDIIKGMKSD
jgi:hypothetical protein